MMQTLYDIAKHIVTELPYSQPEPQGDLQSTLAYRLLAEEATAFTIERVRQFVCGSLPVEKIACEIDAASAHRYLAAAKLVDLEIAEKYISTFQIRQLALLRAPKGEMNMLNAFSNPPLDKEDIDILLANQIDPNHPTVLKTTLGPERDLLLRRIYLYAQEEALIIPEMVSIIETIVHKRFENIQKVATFLPPTSLVVYKGCSGSGKSYAIQKFVEKNVPEARLQEAVQSTDNMKSDILECLPQVYTLNHVHLLGLSTMKMLSKVMKEHAIAPSTIQEGWFHSLPSVEGLFKDLEASLQSLCLHDFDGDYEALCLRVLARAQDKNAAKLPLDQMERAFKTSRESRQQLLNALTQRKNDSYYFHYVDKAGVVHEDTDPKSLVCTPTEIDAEMAATRQLQITERHAQTFGSFLLNFTGQTIEAAFKNVGRL